MKKWISMGLVVLLVTVNLWLMLSYNRLYLIRLSMALPLPSWLLPIIWGW